MSPFTMSANINVFPSIAIFYFFFGFFFLGINEGKFLIAKPETSKKEKIVGLKNQIAPKTGKIEKIEKIEKTGKIEKKIKKPESKESIAEKRNRIIVRSLAELNSVSLVERYIASNFLYKYYQGPPNDKIIDFLRSRILSSEDRPVCYNLIRLLGKIKAKDKESWDILVKIIGQGSLNAELRIAAIESIAKLNEKKAVPLFEKYLVIEYFRKNQEVYSTLQTEAGKLRGKPYTDKEVRDLYRKFREDWKKSVNE